MIIFPDTPMLCYLATNQCKPSWYKYITNTKSKKYKKNTSPRMSRTPVTFRKKSTKETGTGAWQKSSSDCKPCMKNVVRLLYRPVWHATQRKFILCWSLDLTRTLREIAVVEQPCIFLRSAVNWKCWNRWEDTEQISRCQTICVVSLVDH